jgi:hypothetical protein
MMRVRCNARWTVTNLIGRLPGYPGEAWYNLAGRIANIISLADVKKYFRVHFDSKWEKAFVVEKPDRSICCFVKTSKAGLYCLDTVATPCAKQGTTLVTTLHDKKSKYTVCACRQAVLACKLQTMIGYPSTQDFLKIVDQHLIPVPLDVQILLWQRTSLAPMCIPSRERRCAMVSNTCGPTSHNYPTRFSPSIMK